MVSLGQMCESSKLRLCVMSGSPYSTRQSLWSESLPVTGCRLTNLSHNHLMPVQLRRCTGQKSQFRRSEGRRIQVKS